MVRGAPPEFAVNIYLSQVGKGGLPPPGIHNAPTPVSWHPSPVARKWSNRNLPGALHFVTGNVTDRIPAFGEAGSCDAFIQVCAALRDSRPFKLFAYVLMPDHAHMIVNPRDGRIRELTGAIKSLSARAIIKTSTDSSFLREKPDADGTSTRCGKRASRRFRCGAIGSFGRR